MKCMKLGNNKKLHLNAKEVSESIAAASVKENKKNINSPQNRRECSTISGYSTPVRQKCLLNNIEASPDIDYNSTLLPCTQESGNEVAWDWQSSLSKTPEDRDKVQNIQSETPKRTKFLQRKRNSNSPLLYKPLKRKTIEMERVDNIGEFAAELQELNEKMRNIKRDDKDHLSDHIKKEISIIVPSITNNKEEISKLDDNRQDCIRKTNSNDNTNNTSKTNPSYDDLFDDSVDDSMAKCTQEIEEKFNLVTVKENSITETNMKTEESFCITQNTDDKIIPIKQISPNKNCYKETSTKSVFHKGTNDNVLKTYSMKRDANPNLRGSARKNEKIDKSFLNNNNTACYNIKKSHDDKRSSKNSTTDLFDIPDDSFDDFLATCNMDEKLSASTQFLNDSSSTHRSNSTKLETNYKHSSCQPLKKTVSNLENRKFFKTKSLSDQHIGRNAITNTIRNTANIASVSYHTKSTLHLNSQKISTTPHTNITRASVSTNPIATNDGHCKVENNAISLMRNADQTHGWSNVNRSVVKKGSDRFIKYNSTGNIKNDVKEVTRKTDSQLPRCTAEEIEKKRLQAIMRLEAKRKLLSTKLTNNINR